MEQVTAKQRIKVAARDHVIISLLHLRLHGWTIIWANVALCFCGSIAFIIAGIMQPSVESEWEVTDFRRGTISCQNIETGETKKFTPKKRTVFRIKIRNFTLSIQWSKLWGARVGDHIILRDDGWFCSGNHFVRVVEGS